MKIVFMAYGFPRILLSTDDK